MTAKIINYVCKKYIHLKIKRLPQVISLHTPLKRIMVDKLLLLNEIIFYPNGMY